MEPHTHTHIQLTEEQGSVLAEKSGKFEYKWQQFLIVLLLIL